MTKRVSRQSKHLETPGKALPDNLLGELEAEVMHYMWELERATVQRVVRLISFRRTIAYTTVMTVMGHLVRKGLLARTSDGKRYTYRVALTRDEFLRRASRERIGRLVSDFGDLAIAGFIEEIARSVPEKLQQTKDLLETAGKNPRT